MGTDHLQETGKTTPTENNLAEKDRGCQSFSLCSASFFVISYFLGRNGSLVERQASFFATFDAWFLRRLVDFLLSLHRYMLRVHYSLSVLISIVIVEVCIYSAVSILVPKDVLFSYYGKGGCMCFSLEWLRPIFPIRLPFKPAHNKPFTCFI